MSAKFEETNKKTKNEIERLIENKMNKMENKMSEIENKMDQIFEAIQNVSKEKSANFEL